MLTRRFQPWMIAAATGLALASWMAGGVRPVLWAVPAIAWIPALAGFLAWRRRRSSGSAPVAAVEDASLFAGLALLGGMAVYLALGAASGTNGFLFHWLPGAGLPPARSGVLRFAAFAAALLLLGLWRPARRPAWIAAAILVASQAACFIYLWKETGGAAFYRDDHPSFMFRLWAFARSFPSLVFYDPFWNGGRAETVLVSTGVVGPGLLFWPLWRFFPVHEVYTGVVGFVFIVLAPLLAAGSARIAGGRWTAAAAAGLLALAASRYLAKWVLHFGTFGAGFAGLWCLPVAAVLYRALSAGPPRPWLGALLAACAAMFLTWPPSAVMALPLALAVLASCRCWSRPLWRFLIAWGALAALLVLPLYAAVFGQGEPGAFLNAAVRQPSWTGQVARGFASLREQFGQANPLIAFLGLAGLWFLPRPAARTFFGTAIVGLALLAGWGDMIKPQLQLERAGIPMVLVAILPAALWLESLLESAPAALAPVRAALLALLAVGGHESARIWGNQSAIPYEVYRGEIVEFADWIRRNTPENARIAFLGPTVHGYGRGHIAYLPVLTGRSMMACDYYHFSPSRVEYEYPPRDFRQDDEDVRLFTEVYNIGHVITFHDHWKKFLARHPEWFERAAAFGTGDKRVIYRVKRTPDWMAESPGATVRPGINTLDIGVTDPGRAGVLKFNWVEGMNAEPPATVAPWQAAHGRQLILVHPNGQARVGIDCRRSIWAGGGGDDE